MANRSTYYVEHLSLDLEAADRFSKSERRVHALLQRAKSIAGHSPPILDFPRCAYCGASLDFYGQPDNRPFYGKYSFAGDCRGCGWWFCETGNVVDAIGEYRAHHYFEGVLRRFQIDEYSTPLDLLRAHLQRNFKDVRHIHPRKFEELCQGVFREHFHCDVRLTAYSSDGGIDLYVVHSNEPFVVQLKRRSGESREGVTAIREFLGALVLNGQTRGMFVTTADDFTKSAKEAAGNPKLRGLGIQLELNGYKELEGMFRTRSNTWRPWKMIPEVLIPEPQEGGSATELLFPW
jgi:restriction system protein